MSEGDDNAGDVPRQLVDVSTGEVLLVVAVNEEKDKERPTKKDHKNKNIEMQDFPHMGSEITASGNIPRKALIAIEKASLPNARWTRVDRDMGKALGKIKLSARAYQVRDTLLGYVHFGNFVYCSHADISDITGLSISHISDALRELEERDLLVRIERGKTMLNPLYFWCGEEKQRATSVAQYYKTRTQRSAEKERRERQKAKRSRKAEIRVVVDNSKHKVG